MPRLLACFPAFSGASNAKRAVPTRFAPIVTATAAALVLFAPVNAAHAQANLTFSGGSGSPLSLTLANPVTYTITANAAANNAPIFVFDAVGGSAFNFSSATGTLTFSINGGSPQALNFIRNNFSSSVITADDIYMYGPLPGVTTGDLVTLMSGTLTTSANVAVARPADGSFTTFITNTIPARISGNGGAGSVSVPEPGSVALLGMGLLPLAGIVASRRRRA